MAIRLATQEMMDLSEVQQEKKPYSTFRELFDDSEVSDEKKYWFVWQYAHFVTLNGVTKDDLQSMLKFIAEKFLCEVEKPAKPDLKVIHGKEDGERRRRGGD